jgi:hypothetical protein
MQTPMTEFSGCFAGTMANIALRVGSRGRMASERNIGKTQPKVAPPILSRTMRFIHRTAKMMGRSSNPSTCSNFSNNSTHSLLMNKNQNIQREIAESRQEKINFDLRSLAGWAITRAEGNFSPETSLQLLKERVSWMEKAQYKAALKK